MDEFGWVGDKACGPSAGLRWDVGSWAYCESRGPSLEKSAAGCASLAECSCNLLCNNSGRTVPSPVAMPLQPSQYEPATGSLFPATPWSQLVRLRGDDASARAALARVCQLYWYPVYAYIRSRGNAVHDAEDLAQGFFLRLLERGDLANVSERDGRLRNFLLAAMKNYLAYTHRHDMALKRGGAAQQVSLDVEWAEGRLQQELSYASDTDRLFDQRWALALLENVLHELRAEYERTHRGEVFAALSAVLSVSGAAVSYPDISQRLGITEQNARVAAHRLKKRYRELLQKHIEATVESPAEADAELDHLLTVFSTP
jgi:DNA-directed RNA polymerase specialized sigma24 family protein